MKTLIAAISALLLVAMIMNFAPTQSHNDTHSDETKQIVKQYLAWRAIYRPRENSAPDAFRLSVFQESLREIQETNSRQSAYKLGLNQFTDITQEEFVATYLGAKPVFEETEIELMAPTATYTAVNWTAAGAVNTPPNQGSCGSCWAFSTVAVVEGYTFQSTGTLPQLSQQQLVDCATLLYGNLGCQGGNIYPSLGYIQTNGLVSLADYPYTAKQGLCQNNTGPYKIQRRTNNNGCPNLYTDIALQPTGVYVDASTWSKYSSGIFNCTQSTITLNHGVIATGNDANGNVFIRNSWGTSWGVNGYMTLAAGNTCGICSNLSNAPK